MDRRGSDRPLYEGEIALLNSIAATPPHGSISEAKALQVASHVRALRPDAAPAYVAAFLVFAGLQGTTACRQWHQASYAKYAQKSEYPSGDDPYIWGRDRIAASAAWANVEIGYAVERLELSGVPILSFSNETGARTSSGVIEDYLFEHYRVVAARVDGNERNPAEGSRLAQMMFARKDIAGFLNVISRGYTHPSENALLHSVVANKDVSLCSYVTDFEPDFKVLLYGVGKELDAWMTKNYPERGVNWGLVSGVRPLSRTSVRVGNLAGNPRNSTHGRGVAADIILAGPGAYQLIEAGRKAWSEALWKTALSGISAKYGLRHLGPSLNDWPHIDIDPRGGTSWWWHCPARSMEAGDREGGGRTPCYAALAARRPAWRAACPGGDQRHIQLSRYRRQSCRRSPATPYRKSDQWLSRRPARRRRHR